MIHETVIPIAILSGGNVSITSINAVSLASNTLTRSVISTSCLDSGKNTVMPLMHTAATIYTHPFNTGDGITHAFNVALGLVASSATVGIGSAKTSLYFEQGQLNISTAAASTVANTSWNVVATLFTNNTTTGTWTSGPITTLALPYGRFKIVTVTPNSASTIQINHLRQTGA